MSQRQDHHLLQEAGTKPRRFGLALGLCALRKSLRELWRLENTQHDFTSKKKSWSVPETWRQAQYCTARGGTPLGLVRGIKKNDFWEVAISEQSGTFPPYFQSWATCSLVLYAKVDYKIKQKKKKKGMLSMWPAINLPSLSGDSCPSREVDCVFVCFSFLVSHFGHFGCDRLWNLLWATNYSLSLGLWIHSTIQQMRKRTQSLSASVSWFIK